MLLEVPGEVIVGVIVIRHRLKRHSPPLCEVGEEGVCGIQVLEETVHICPDNQAVRCCGPIAGERLREIPGFSLA